MKLTLETAQKIVALALEKRLELGMKPLTIAVLDDGGHLKALAREDGNQHTAARDRSRQGKRCDCNGVLGSRALYNRAQKQPYFIQAMNELANGLLVPVPGRCVDPRCRRDCGGSWHYG